MSTIPNLTEPCPCSRNAMFGECCGASPNTTPRGVLIIHNAIEDKKCDYIVEYMKKQPMRWAEATKGESIENPVNKTDRITQEVKKGKLEKQIIALIKKLFTEIVNDKLGKTLQWFETPVVLFYTKDGQYKPHSDSEYFDSVTRKWKKLVDRDYSILLYLSDDFTGGDLTFNMFGFSYHPKKGDVVFFPSDSRYKHEAERVLSGNRYAIVSWCAVKESPKLSERPPAHAILV